MDGFWIVVGVLLVLAVIGFWWALSRRRGGSDDPGWHEGQTPSGEGTNFMG
jgi:hypothetical protein